MIAAEQVAENFSGTGETIASVEPYGHGIIHDTYLVTVRAGNGRFILQRINTKVFAEPETVMHNLRLVCEHVRKQLHDEGSGAETAWQVVQVIPARDGRDFFVAADGSFWRALRFIRDAAPMLQVSSLDDAREVGRALGTFHRLISGLNPERLHVPLPGFHNIEQYLLQYDAVMGRMREADEAGEFCREFIAMRRGWAPVLENARRDGILKVRVIHGDPKTSNIMVDSVTGRAVSIIDLDTVMPGLVQYDVGDCLRSCCNTQGEEAADFSAVRFDRERGRAVLEGYAEAACRFLTEADFDFFFEAIRLIPFELGLRFYTDFVAGNEYFKVGHWDQNLHRAMVQFKLVESIEKQEDGIRAVIEECRMVFLPGNFR